MINIIHKILLHKWILQLFWAIITLKRGKITSKCYKEKFLYSKIDVNTLKTVIHFKIVKKIYIKFEKSTQNLIFSQKNHSDSLISHFFLNKTQFYTKHIPKKTQNLITCLKIPHI